MTLPTTKTVYSVREHKLPTVEGAFSLTTSRDYEILSVEVQDGQPVLYVMEVDTPSGTSSAHQFLLMETNRRWNVWWNFVGNVFTGGKRLHLFCSSPLRYQYIPSSGGKKY